TKAKNCPQSCRVIETKREAIASPKGVSMMESRYSSSFSKRSGSNLFRSRVSAIANLRSGGEAYHVPEPLPAKIRAARVKGPSLQEGAAASLPAEEAAVGPSAPRCAKKYPGVVFCVFPFWRSRSCRCILKVPVRREAGYRSLTKPSPHPMKRGF